MDIDPNQPIHPSRPPVPDQDELDRRKLIGQLEDVGETLEEINKKLTVPNIVAWVVLLSWGFVIILFIASIAFGFSLEAGS